MTAQERECLINSMAEMTVDSMDLEDMIEILKNNLTDSFKTMPDNQLIGIATTNFPSLLKQ